MVSLSLDILKPYTSARFTSSVAAGVGFGVVILGGIFGLLSMNNGKVDAYRQTKLAHDYVKITEKVIITPRKLQDSDIVSDTPPSEGDAYEHALIAAPVKSVTEYIGKQKLPQLSMDGTAPFDVYKKPYFIPADQEKPIMGVVIAHLDRMPAAVQQKTLQALPHTVSLFLSPYTEDLQDALNGYRKMGFESWLRLPLQTQAYPFNDTGNKTLLYDSSLRLNMDKLNWVLSQALGYAGVYSETDSLFQYSDNMVESLFGALFERGLGYVDLSPTPLAAISNQALLYNAPYIRAQTYIASKQDLEKVDEAIAAAKAEGYATIVFEAAPALLDLMPTILESIQNKGIEITPVSAIDSYKWAHNLTNQ